ncbi:MAG: hypothetical protein GX060_06200 [Firmicutes bacterium]|nr:hypothetical protein [Bacillota bacterium]
MKQKLKSQLLLIGAGVILEQATWPGTVLPFMLGPAFLFGLAPLVPVSDWGLLVATLASALLGWYSGDYALLGAVILHFALWHWAEKRQQRGLLATAIVLPLLLNQIFIGEWSYPTVGISIASALCQLLIYQALQKNVRSRLDNLQQQYHNQQGAERLALGIAQWEHIGQIGPLLQELISSIDQTYAVYQELEVGARANPALPETLPSRLLAAAQSIHQVRLQLQAWQQEQASTLRKQVGKQIISLRTLCYWVIVHLTQANANDDQIIATIEFADNPSIASEQQLPLAALLLTICRQGLAELPSGPISLNFNGYASPAGMRIVVTMAPQSDEPSGEWPLLTPYEIGAHEEFQRQLKASCQRGITTRGELIFTLELKNNEQGLSH